jgi:ferredoxin
VYDSAVSDGAAMRVVIDPDLCIGSGECVRVAPTAFRIDEARGVSTPLPAAQALDRDTLDEVAFNCPTRAISVEAAS